MKLICNSCGRQETPPFDVGDECPWCYGILEEVFVQAEMQPVGSSLIKEVGYDEAGEKLWVRFHEGGLYVYSEGPKEVYEEMLSCRSVGRYFHQNVRLQFSCRRADEGGVY